MGGSLVRVCPLELFPDRPCNAQNAPASTIDGRSAVTPSPENNEEGSEAHGKIRHQMGIASGAIVVRDMDLLPTARLI